MSIFGQLFGIYFQNGRGMAEWGRNTPIKYHPPPKYPLNTVPALGEDQWANFQGTPDFPIIIIKSRFYYINGPHNQYVLIDTSRTFIFRQGLPGKCLGKRPIIKHPIPRASAWDGGDLGSFLKTFPWKSLTKHKGKAHICQDVLVMGPCM